MPTKPGRNHHRVVFFVRGPVLRDRIDLGMVLEVAEHRMTDRWLAELTRHGDMLCVTQILVPEEDDFPFEESIPYRLQLLRWQGLREINAADLCTDVKGQGSDPNRPWPIGTQLLRRYHLSSSSVGSPAGPWSAVRKLSISSNRHSVSEGAN